MSQTTIFLALLAFSITCAPVLAQEPGGAKTIEQRFRELQERYEERIAALEGEVRALRAEAEGHHDDHGHAIDHAIAGLHNHAGAEPSPGFQLRPTGRSRLQLSLDVLFVAGASSERDASIQTLQGGGHDPKRRGFTLSQVELSGSGAVDDYFTGEAHLVYIVDSEGELVTELEEAFLLTTSLPAGLQVEAGQSYLDFGRINPLHPHQWDFVDQPVINSRLFGADGMRSQGARVGWAVPLPWPCEVRGGVYNANGETMPSFYAGDQAIGGRPYVSQDVRDFGDLAYLLRLDNRLALNPCTSMVLGASAAWGPNATGVGGSTWVLGGDLTLRYKPYSSCRTWPFLAWQSEVMLRNYRADDYFDAGDPVNPADDVAIAAATLRDWGFYSQLLWGFESGWIAGLRGEYASGSGSDVDAMTGASVSRSTDPFRDDRLRLSALISFLPSEFSRLRLQYNYDQAEHLDEPAHSIWLGVEFLFGDHPAHTH